MANRHVAKAELFVAQKRLISQLQVDCQSTAAAKEQLREFDELLVLFREQCDRMVAELRSMGDPQ